MSTKFKTLREFLHPKGMASAKVKVPDYQRGYKWAVKRDDRTPSSAEHMLSTLLDAWKATPERPYFLQGITVVEELPRIELIDGQQRITTLYLILWSLGREFVTGWNDFDLGYEIREEAGNFLRNLKEENGDAILDREAEDEPQDIHWFREALHQIRSILADTFGSEPDGSGKRDGFAKFLYDKVTFLCVAVNRAQAAETFTMMNGQKATMHTEELVKAHLLHQVSMPAGTRDAERPATFAELLENIRDYAAQDWETEALRSRHAREWDRWVYWWNRKDVQEFFGTDGRPLGLLLRYFHRNGTRDDGLGERSPWGHEYFKTLAQSPRDAKLLFKALRDLQKRFEDVFNAPKTHNFLELALICTTGWEDKCNILGFFLSPKSEAEMRAYAQWRLVGATHDESVSEDASAREAHAYAVCEILGADIVYGQCDAYKVLAARQLLRLNVEEYNKLEGGKGVPFDFAVWRNNSLEHVLPKSWVFHDVRAEDGSIRHVRGDDVILSDEEVAGLFRREEMFADGGSEHCIGNLVLLWKPDNSAFGALGFADKKRMFFDLDSGDTRTGRKFRFASRNLLHSIAVFAEPEWSAATIIKHRDIFVERFRKDYGIGKEER